MKEYKINGKIIRLNIFNKIRDANDAYLIGYILCDGSYHQKTYKRAHRMAVSSTDIDIIDFFVKHFQPDSDPKNREPMSNKDMNIIGKKRYKNLVFSSKFSPCFNKFGVMNLKKDRTYVNIDSQNFNAFLLGCFDADGSISWGRRKDRNRLWADFKITHGSLKFLTKLQKDLHRIYGISTFVAPKGDEKCYVLRISERAQVSDLFYILYKNKPEVYNTKKEESYKKFVKSYAT